MASCSYRLVARIRNLRRKGSRTKGPFGMDLSIFLTPEAWISLVTLIFLEIVLGALAGALAARIQRQRGKRDVSPAERVRQLLAQAEPFADEVSCQEDYLR